MSLIDSIKKEREKQQAKAQYTPSLFDIAAGFSATHGGAEAVTNNINNILSASQDWFMNNSNLEYFATPSEDEPLFQFVEESELSKISQIISQLDNPYIKYARTFEDMVFSAKLHSYNPNIHVKDLLTHGTAKLLKYEIAKGLLPEAEAGLQKIRSELRGIIDTSMQRLAEKIGFEYSDNAEEYMQRMKNKLAIEYLKDAFQVSGSTVDEITEHIKKNRNAMEMLGISQKDAKVSEFSGRLDELIKTKIGDPYTMMRRGIQYTESMPLKTGVRVRIYPGGNRNNSGYDWGGDVEKVPAGSYGIIDSITNDEKLHVELDSGKGWYVTPREIEQPFQVVTKGYSLDSKYGISKKIAEAIFSSDYAKIKRAAKTEFSLEQKKDLAILNEKVTEYKKHIAAVEGTE